MAALVIGNASYPGRVLKNAVNDAIDISKKLMSYGFEVITATDVTNQDMDERLREFRELLYTYDVGLFFFAGHGVQVEGKNYLMAVDTKMASPSDAKHSSLPLDKVLDDMSGGSAPTRIVILDACRNDPWSRSPAAQGLASVYAPKGTIIGFATSPGETAGDGIGRNGVYTSALLQHIDMPDSPIEAMFKRVRNSVAAATNGKQTTWEHTSLSGEFYFNLGLGKKIKEYGDLALADARFHSDPEIDPSETILALRSLNWHTQNPAVNRFNSSKANSLDLDTLFVIGRNIYQAACGSSGSAVGFIESFRDRTAKFDPDKRKAVLDGMLFEIFFNSKGELRQNIKGQRFDEVFELQLFDQLRDSFDFIANALVAAGASYYALPGKGHKLEVTVKVKSAGEHLEVEGIFIDSVDILRVEQKTNSWGWDPSTTISRSRFEANLSEELVVPTRLLTVTYVPLDPGASQIRLKSGWTVRKQVER